MPNPSLQEFGILNPPRKAKRLRELALKEGPSVTQEFQLPPIPPSRPSSPPLPTPPRRRGRKPAGALSKSAREQLRKTNHSVIEKRRREKINEALAALRQLVPNDKQQESAEKKDKEEREFKLEVLVRTVDYLRNIVDRMALLEQGICRHCGGPLAPTAPCFPPTPASYPEESRIAKRKRDGEEEDYEHSDGEDSDYDMLEEPNAQGPPTREPSQLPRLPSISSWLGDVTTSPVQQLPSPPQSGPFAATEVATSSLPSLVLPPAVKIPDTITMAGGSPSPGSYPSSSSPPFNAHSTVSPGSCGTLGTSTVSTGDSSSKSGPSIPPSPSGSASYFRHRSNPLQIRSLCHRNAPDDVLSNPSTPSSKEQMPIRRRRWSRDEQTAVSLLLNFSSKRSSADDMVPPHPPEAGYRRNQMASLETLEMKNRMAFEVYTPRSMLGMPSRGSEAYPS